MFLYSIYTSPSKPSYPKICRALFFFCQWQVATIFLFVNRYLKSVFPTVEEYLLLDVLSNSDNNVQKGADRLVKMGYVKRDTPSNFTDFLFVCFCFIMFCRLEKLVKSSVFFLRCSKITCSTKRRGKIGWKANSFAETSSDQDRQRKGWPAKKDEGQVWGQIWYTGKDFVHGLGVGSFWRRPIK